MTINKLVNVKDPLAKAFSELDPKTIQHSSEITNQRRTNEDLRNQWFWTADFAMYGIDGSDAVLYLAKRPQNLIFKNIKKATQQLIKTDNYKPKKKDIAKVIDSKDTLKLKLSDLNLDRSSSQYTTFKILTDNYDKLNNAQRKAAERVFGQGDNFKRNMKVFKDADIYTTRFYVLTPDYIKNNVKRNSVISKACYLDTFGDDSDFYAGSRGVTGSLIALRGVPKIAEGSAQKIKTPTQKQIIKIINQYMLRL